MISFLNAMQKNVHAAMRVLNQMRDADVKPDSQTFSYLLGNCSSEEAINKVIVSHCLVYSP